MSRMWDAGKSVYVFCAGKKGSGKSHLAYTMWKSFPGPRLVLDITRDVRKEWLQPLGVEHTLITPETIPLRWPTPADSDAPPATLVYHPDMGASTAVDDLDRALGVALTTHGVCIWIDEIGAMTTGNKTPPNLARLLHYGRHTDTSAIMCGPRPIDVDPLCVAQADYLGVFRLHNRADRRRIADNSGIELEVYDFANAALADHEYLWFDARSGVLRHMPPLPRIQRQEVYEGVPS